MTTLEQLRARAEAIQAGHDRALGQLFRDPERRRTLYSDEEHDEVIEEVRRLVAEAEQEIAVLEDGDTGAPRRRGPRRRTCAA
jgi:hypothetical protein